MKPIELKITRIGNSRGIRLPAATIKRYGLGSTVVMEQRADGIFLRPTGPAIEKLSWDDTAREMAVASEDWSNWDSASGDGLVELPWESEPISRVAEPRPSYTSRNKKKQS